MKPLYDHVLLKEVPEEDKIGNLVIADQIEATKRAQVISIGDTVAKVSVGDIVLFDRQYTTQTRINGEDYLLVREKDGIYCILHSEQSQQEVNNVIREALMKKI